MIDTNSTAMARARRVAGLTVSEVATTPVETVDAAKPCSECGGELDAQWCRGCSGRGAVPIIEDGRFESESCDRCSGAGSEFWCENCGVNR